MIQIKIKEQYKDDYITRAAGERLRLAILAAHRDQKKVEVDFSGLIVGSTSFFDEAFAKLSEEGWDAERFEKGVVLKELNKMDLRVLKQVCEYRGLKLRLKADKKK